MSMRSLKDIRVLSDRLPLYEDGKLSGAVSIFRNRTEVAQLADDLVLGIFAHRARVQNDQIRVGFVGSAQKTHRFKDSGDGFRIAFVHLATHGDDMESSGAVGKIAHARGKFALAMKFAF